MGCYATRLRWGYLFDTCWVVRLMQYDYSAKTRFIHTHKPAPEPDINAVIESRPASLGFLDVIDWLLDLC
jgi:hypothetical protein